MPSLSFAERNDDRRYVTNFDENVNQDGMDAMTAMREIFKKIVTFDKGGRRCGNDRRGYTYTLHIPERRTGDDRRRGEDRRKMPRVSLVADGSPN